MALDFSKNAILQGNCDYFCIVCETYFISEEGITIHVSSGKHQENLSSIQQFDEFMAHGIKKINGKYFCEPCNKLLPILPRVCLHIEDSNHEEKISYYIFKRKNNIVVAFEQFVINEQSWHGLQENSCALCNIEYEDKELHKADSCHIINLIQKRVEFDKNKNIYRKVDEVSFQCLTCNRILALHNLTSHFNEVEHKCNYEACCETYQKIKDDPEQKPNKSNALYKDLFKAEAKNDKNDSTVLNNNRKKQIKKPGTGIKNVKPEVKVLKQIINDVKDVYDEKCEENICKILNTTDYITKDENGKTFCILCDWIMDPFKVFHHVHGQHHQTILKLHKKRVENQKNIYKSPENVSNKIPTDKDNMLLLNSVDTFQKNGININFETNSATCKKCKIALEYDYKAISQHVKDHNKSTPTKQKKKPAEFPSGSEKVGDKKNSLFTTPVHLKNDTRDKVIELNNKTDDTINVNNVRSETKNSIKIQIAKTELKRPKKKVSLLVYLKNITLVENSIFKDVILNEKFVINYLSFGFIAQETQNIYKCIVCVESATFIEILEHAQTSRHEAINNESSVILDVDSEFIREVKGRYHCGFCNVLKASWDELLQHLETASHKEAKNSAYWRLMQYEPELAINRVQRQFQENFDFLNYFLRH